jgi:hypothetical protein
MRLELRAYAEHFAKLNLTITLMYNAAEHAIPRLTSIYATVNTLANYVDRK